jgi:hypothetical protein
MHFNDTRINPLPKHAHFIVDVGTSSANIKAKMEPKPELQGENANLVSRKQALLSKKWTYFGFGRLAGEKTGKKASFWVGGALSGYL